MSWVARHRGVAASIIVAAAWLAIAGGLIWTRPTRESVRTYVRLIAAANRQDLETLRTLCTRRYLDHHELAPADEGGVVGLPRSINKNFQVWRQGPNVWLCPTNRAGPVYQFVLERGDWRFDGPVGLLRGRGEFLPLIDQPEPSDRAEGPRREGGMAEERSTRP